MGTLNNNQEFGFNIDNHCSDWGDVINRPTTITIGGTTFSGSVIEEFIEEIYTELYPNRPKNAEIKTVIKYQKEQYQLVAYILSTQPAACWIKLRNL